MRRALFLFITKNSQIKQYTDVFIVFVPLVLFEIKRWVDYFLKNDAQALDDRSSVP